MMQSDKNKKRQYQNAMLGMKVYDDDHDHKAGDNLINFFFGDHAGFRGSGFLTEDNLYDKVVDATTSGKAKETLLSLSEPLDSRKKLNEFYDEYGYGRTVGNLTQGVLGWTGEGIVAGKVLSPVAKVLGAGYNKLSKIFRRD